MRLQRKRAHSQPEMKPNHDEQVGLFLSLLNEFHEVHHKAQSIRHELLPQGHLTPDAQRGRPALDPEQNKSPDHGTIFSCRQPVDPLH